MTVFAVTIAAGDIIKYQALVYESFVWGIHVRYNNFDYYPSRQCNIYFIIPNRTLDPLLFSEVLLLLNIPIKVRGDPKGKLE